MNGSEKKSKKVLLIAGIAAVSAAVAVFLGVFFWGLHLKGTDTVFPNVCVSGVNIGGMDKETAVAALETSLSSTHATRTLTVQLPDRKLVFDPEMANSPLDAAAMVDAAMSYGREGGAFKVLSTFVKCKESAYILDMGDFLKVDTEYVRSLIDKTAEDVAQEVVQSEVTMDEEKSVITIQLGQNGRSLDADKLYEKVMAAYESGDLSDIEFSYDLVPYDIVDLQSYYNEYCISAHDAYYDKSTRTIVEEQEGYGFDLIAANQQVALGEEGSVIEIPLQVLKPEITKEEYQKKHFGDTLASYSINYTGNANRTTNLRLACEAIDGIVIQPNGIFSFNEIVGQRTAEKGYKEGIIYADGGASESEIGGGICQIASMIYYCTLMADLQTVERKPHMYVVSYVNPGMDATVYWGALDFQFRNTNSTPIMVNTSVKNGTVSVSLTGINEHDYTVKMTYELTATTPYEEIEILDETKPAGYREQVQAPHTGYTYWTYKNFYDLNGNFLRKEKCDISVYEKYDAKYIVGPEPVVEVPEIVDEIIPDVDDMLSDIDGIWEDLLDEYLP